MNHRFPLTLTALICLSGLCCGCSVQVDGDSSSGDESGAEAASPADDRPATPGSMLSGVPGASGGERVRAEAGVGKQGQSLQDEEGVGGMIVQPARTLFAVKQRTVFEIQIPSAMKLFEATEGRKPKSHDEYMNKIIKANRIKLPELPAGQKYVYDPELGELMVEKR